MKYQEPEQEVGMVAEDAAVAYTSRTHSDISLAITGEEPQDCSHVSTESPSAIWFLKQMLAKSEKDIQEGRVYTHEEVMQMLKQKKYGNTVDSERV